MKRRAIAVLAILAACLAALAEPVELGSVKSAAEYRGALSGAIFRGLEDFAISVRNDAGWFSESLTGSALESIDYRADGACPWYDRCGITTSRSGARVRVAFKVVYKVPAERRDREIAEAEQAARALAAEAQEKDGEAERLLFIHDALVQRARYDERLKREGKAPPESYTPYGALVAGVCVCDGFSKAFLLVASMLDLECRIVKGQGDGGPHSWNLVNVEGAWYHVDVTFDLVDPPYGWSRGHFMVDDAVMSRNHEWDRSAYPACEDGEADYYSRSGSSVADLDEAADYLARLRGQPAGRYEFRIRDFEAQSFNSGIVGLAKEKLRGRSWSMNTDWGSGLVILELKR